MNPLIHKLKTTFFFSVFTFSALLTSCDNEEERWTDVKEETKTEIITDLDARRIISFKVTNPGETQAIHSVVNNLEKTITVYLPSYYEYQHLETAITLPEKTTITPAATELIPVFSKTPVTYTTKAADGTTAVYTVKIVIQQPELILDDLSTATTTSSFSVFGVVTVKGQNFVPSYEVTKLFVVDAQGNKKLQLKQYNEGLDITTFTIKYVFGATTFAETALETNTDYWLMIESYNLSKTMKYPVRFR